MDSCWIRAGFVCTPGLASGKPRHIWAYGHMGRFSAVSAGGQKQWHSPGFSVPGIEEDRKPCACVDG